jgi:hypothetical protein
LIKEKRNENEEKRELDLTFRKIGKVVALDG